MEYIKCKGRARLILVCGGGGVQGFGGGSARGEGTLEYRTPGGDIPHQGGGQEELLVWTRKGGGALIKIYFKVVVIKCKPYRTGL